MKSPVSILYDGYGNPTFIAAKGTPQIITASGDTILHTPTSGKACRLRWIGIKAPKTNNAEVIINIKLGSTVIYTWILGNPDVFAHSTIRVGNINENLVINKSNTQTLYVNFDLDEVDA